MQPGERVSPICTLALLSLTWLMLAVSGGLLTLLRAYALIRGKASKKDDASLLESTLAFAAFTGCSAASFRLWEGLLSKFVVSKPLRAFLAGLASGWPIALLPSSTFRSYATLYMAAQALGALYSTGMFFPFALPTLADVRQLLIEKFCLHGAMAPLSSAALPPLVFSTVMSTNPTFLTYE